MGAAFFHRSKPPIGPVEDLSHPSAERQPLSDSLGHHCDAWGDSDDSSGSCAGVCPQGRDTGAWQTDGSGPQGTGDNHATDNARTQATYFSASCQKVVHYFLWTACVWKGFDKIGTYLVGGQGSFTVKIG